MTTKNDIWREYIERKTVKSPLAPFTKRELHLMQKAFYAGYDWIEWFKNNKGGH